MASFCASTVLQLVACMIVGLWLCVGNGPPPTHTHTRTHTHTHTPHTQCRICKECGSIVSLMLDKAPATISALSDVQPEWRCCMCQDKVKLTSSRSHTCSDSYSSRTGSYAITNCFHCWFVCATIIDWSLIFIDWLTRSLSFDQFKGRTNAWGLVVCIYNYID